MKEQIELGLHLNTKRIRNSVFLDAMKLVVPRRQLAAMIAVASPVAATGGSQLARKTMHRIHFPHPSFSPSHLALQETLLVTSL